MEHGDLGKGLKWRGEARRGTEKNVEFDKNQLKKRKKTSASLISL